MKGIFTPHKQKLTLGSLFDGSGGFPLAGAMNGIVPVWASEIEPFPIRVTTKRFPAMRHYGDIREMHGDQIEPVDIITFGSPCQDMSVAGKRAGIHGGKRSSLFFEAARIIREMREATHGKYPTFAVWENVYGAFSSNGGEDFQSVVETLCQIADESVSIPRPDKWQSCGFVRGGGYSLAWRVFDAQYWGVPQRRRRVYLVADFGGERAGKVLFERESLCGNYPTGGEPRQGASEDAAGRADGSSGVRCLNPWDCQSKRVFLPDGCYPTLPAMDGGGANNQAVCYSIDPLSSNSMKSQNPHSGFHETDVVKCLDTSDGNPSKNQGGTVVVGAFMGGQGAKARSIGYSEEVSPTLKAAPSGGNTVPDVVYSIEGNVCDRTSNKNGKGYSENVTPTLNTQDKHCVAFNGKSMQDNEQARCFCALQFAGYKDALPLLRASGGDLGGGSEGILCFPIDQHQQDARFRLCEDGIVPTMTSHMGTGGNNTPMVLGQAYCIGNGQLNQISMSDKCNTLDCMHDKQAVLTDGKPPRKYIVRRLTPTECARLQGFPCWWCMGLGTENASEEELQHWIGVWNTWNRANGLKETTKNRVMKWLKDPHSDSAEYKLWGNGIALPNASYVLEGIAMCSAKEDEIV